MDRLMLSRSHGLGYCLKDQLNNRRGSSPLHSLSLFCLRHYRGLPYPHLSLCSFSPRLLLILTSLFLPYTLCSCPLAPRLPPPNPSNLSPSPLQSGTISGAACPDCCCRQTIRQCCLPSGHLAPNTTAEGIFGADSRPWQSEKQTEGQSG